jgi:hypothetical protein
MSEHRAYFLGFRRFPGQACSRWLISSRRKKRIFYNGFEVLSTLILLIFSLVASGGLAIAATEGDSNNFFGTGAGASNSGDLNANSFFGAYAGYFNTTGYDNSFFGESAGYSNATGSSNSFFGESAGYSNTTGSDNSFFGLFAGYSNTAGGFNSFFGESAGYSNTTGNDNSFFGLFAGASNTAGGSNSFFGESAGYSNTTGSYNSFFGLSAGAYNTTGQENSFLGVLTGYHQTVENYNTFVGYSADLNPGVDPETNPVTNATAIGAYSYVSQSNSLVLGSIKGVNSAGSNVNVGIGISAPARQLHLKGDNAVFRMDRSTDTAAFIIVRTNLAGTAILKTFVVGANASGLNDGEFVINDLGNAVGGPGSRRMTIDNSGDVEFTGSVTATGGFYPASSIALKTNVRTYGNALETVKRLRGVRFDWKASGKQSVGLIAEEVEEVVPEVVAHLGNGGAATGLNYDSLVGVLVEAVKEQERERDSMQAELDILKAEVRQLKVLLLER